MKPSLIIFDWDGTVVDSTQTIAEAASNHDKMQEF